MFDEWRATPIEEGTSETEPVSVPGTPASFAGSDGVTYRTTFTDPRESDEQVAVLELNGLYAHAEVEVTGRRLTGESVVTHDAYFVPLSIPFEPEDESENELVVRCESPHDAFGGIHDTDMVPESAAVPGIWWDARLEARELPYIERMDVKPQFSGDGVVLNVSTTVVADESIDSSITYSIKPEGDLKSRGMMQRASIETTGPGRTTVEHTVDVHDPALWWPRGYGNQNRYQLRAKLGETEHSVTTGICDIRYEDGQFFVNDEKIPIRGVNLITADPEDIERAREVNVNLVRAHAHVLPPEVYEACDREGILVWQDLPLTGDVEYPEERGQELATSLARHYSHHPSLAAFGIHDDPVDTFADGLDSGILDRFRLRWRAWRTEYDAEVPERIADSLGDRRPTFPVIGGPGVGADAVSYYPGWDYGTVETIDSLLSRYGGEIVAEFGAGSITEDNSSTAAGFNRQKHDRHADNLEESQTYQASVVRSLAERLRSNGMGSILFCLRDTDHAGMGVYEQTGGPKPARDALATAFKPIQAFVTDPTPGKSTVVVVNDGTKGLSVTLEWEAGSMDGSLDLTLTPQGRLETDPIDIPRDADQVIVTLVTDHGTIETSYEL